MEHATLEQLFHQCDILSQYVFVSQLLLSLFHTRAHTHTYTRKQVVLALGDYMSVQCHACIGGTSIGEDIRKLDYGQHIVSGTPGRVFGMVLSL